MRFPGHPDPDCKANSQSRARGPGRRACGHCAPQAPPGPGQPPNTCAVLPHLAAAPPEPGNRNQNQGPSRPRAGPSLVVYILQAASAIAVAIDVNRAPRPAGGASGRGAPQSTTGPAPGPRAPSRLWDLAQCAAQIGFEAETAAFAEGNFNTFICQGVPYGLISPVTYARLAHPSLSGAPNLVWPSSNCFSLAVLLGGSFAHS